MDYINCLPKEKYHQLDKGEIVSAQGSPYVLAMPDSNGIVITLDSRCNSILKSQLELYRDARIRQVPVCLKGVSETIRSMLSERQERESLLQEIISESGFLNNGVIG